MDAAGSGHLKAEHETGDCTDRTRWRDRNGAVRYYLDNAGSGDSAYTIRQHYDTERRLRFIHVTAGAVSGGSMENRVWIGANGEVLRDEFKAEGWSFSDFGDPALWTLDPDKVEPGECRG